MDPDTSLAQLISALGAANIPAARAALDALVQWHDRGGCLPRWPADGSDPVGLAAFHLGRLVAAIDLSNDRAVLRRGGGAVRRSVDLEYGRALAAIGVVLDRAAGNIDYRSKKY
jgi:hypothetical protein